MEFIAKGQSKIFDNPKGWLEVIWGATLDTDEYMTIAQHMLGMLMLMGDRGDDLVMLIDFSGLETITKNAATLATGATRDLGCRKIAGFGIKPEHQMILDTIKKGSTKADTIGEFATRAEAEAWLLKR